MGGTSNDFERDLSVFVDFYSDHGTDADSQTDAWLSELEQKIFDAVKNDELSEGFEDVVLSFAEFKPTETSREKRGDLVTIWQAEFMETLSVSE